LFFHQRGKIMGKIECSTKMSNISREEKQADLITRKFVVFRKVSF
jgi:hypothetical protein